MSIFLQYCGQLRVPMVRVSFTKLNNNFWVHLLSTRKLYFSINEILTHPKWNEFWQIILELKRNHNIMKNPLLSKNRCKYEKRQHTDHTIGEIGRHQTVCALFSCLLLCMHKKRKGYQVNMKTMFPIILKILYRSKLIHQIAWIFFSIFTFFYHLSLIRSSWLWDVQVNYRCFLYAHTM